ncbi:glycosyltransferase family A protein [Sulfurospirillum sp. 1307]
MKNNVFMTVFTPTFNRADKLDRVYKSIKNQTLQKINNKYIFEWIIVDDGSTDNTKELVEKWQKESDFEIRYFYQKNMGKPHASRKGIEKARGEWFLFCDSDDEFLPETFETFYSVWRNFTEEEKAKCGGIGVLCQDQYGNRIGCDYPIANKLIPTLDIFFKWRDIGLGETWALLKTENLKKAFTIPDEAKNLKFIPESFFWSRITFEIKPYSYFLNKVLRIYYRNESDNISQNIRQKYPEGFLFESKWFVARYWWMLFRYPKVYAKHLLKVIYFGFSLYKVIKL